VVAPGTDALAGETVKLKSVGPVGPAGQPPLPTTEAQPAANHAALRVEEVDRIVAPQFSLYSESSVSSASKKRRFSLFIAYGGLGSGRVRVERKIHHSTEGQIAANCTCVVKRGGRRMEDLACVHWRSLYTGMCQGDFVSTRSCGNSLAPEDQSGSMRSVI
jgi:hypothetical protein